MPGERVAIFIDNSNVFHNLFDLKKIDRSWVSIYNPLELGKKLAGGREIVFIGFYCSRPPSYLLEEGSDGEKKYKTSMRYYSAIEKLPGITVKYGSLKGNKGDTQEKNLDTQLTTDIVKMAALNEFDVAIIVSNDGDYASPSTTAKDTFKKRIEIAFFKGSLSMHLKKISDLTRRLRRSYFINLPLDDDPEAHNE